MNTYYTISDRCEILFKTQSYMVAIDWLNKHSLEYQAIGIHDHWTYDVPSEHLVVFTVKKR